MTLYLTDQTSAEDIVMQKRRCGRCEMKAGATTLSDHGVSDWSKWMQFAPPFQKQKCSVVHGEVTDPHVDIFERETRFVRDILVS